MSGLQAGDQLLEVNNISFEVIPIHTASTVLRSSNRLKMKVVTPPKKTSHKDRKDGKWYVCLDYFIPAYFKIYFKCLALGVFGNLEIWKLLKVNKTQSL